MNFCKHKYFVIYRGDDTDFPGNQELIVELNTTRDLTGCSAHFSFQGFTQDFAEIPSDKKLRLVIPNSATGNFALGAADAKLWLTYGSSDPKKIRTVENRIHIIVTNNVGEAYDNDDPQAITVTISGGGGGATVVLDDTVTEKSPNGVKSSGIWSWVKSLLPHWLTSDYAEPATVESVADKRDKSDLAVYSVTRTENTDWTWTSENAELAAALNEASVKPIYDSENHFWVITGTTHWGEFYYNSPGVYDVDALSVRLAFITIPGYVDYYATATRPRYIDKETLGPAKPNQQLAAVATGDAQTPTNNCLVKYDAANDRFVKAIPAEDYATKAVVSQKADRATTLSGYGITDAAKLSDIIDPALAAAVGKIADAKLTRDFVNLMVSTNSAHYLTARAGTAGAYTYPPFTSAAALRAALAAHTDQNPQFFYAGEAFTPTKNDWVIVSADEDHPLGTITPASRYGFVGTFGSGGSFQYQVSYKLPLTTAQIAALDSGATSTLLSGLESDGTATDDFATDLLGKQVAKEAITASLAAAYSETATYSVGDAVTHDGKLYKCAVAITTAETWTPAHWTETTVATLWNNADTTSYGGQN